MSNCTSCNTPKEGNKTTWWSCQNYFNLSGYFCGDCYDKVSHDSYGKPEQPAEYLAMLLKLGFNK